MTFPDFVGRLQEVLDRDLSGCGAMTRLVADLELDELEMFRTVDAIQQINRDFYLPEQVDIEELTLADVHFYCLSMTEENRPT